jgi:DNA-binding MarR family transcriptional regulator
VSRFVRAFGLHQPDQTPCGTPIAVSEAHAISELAREGELRQIDLVRRLKLEKSTTSRLVSQIVKRGWAERGPAPDDGRGVLVRLTPQGRIAADQLAAARRRRFATALDRIPEDQRDAVLHALSLLAEAVDET